MTKPLIQQESLSQSQKGAQSPVERTPPPVFAPEGSVVEHKSLMNHDTIEATQHLLDPDLSVSSYYFKRSFKIFQIYCKVKMFKIHFWICIILLV